MRVGGHPLLVCTARVVGLFLALNSPEGWFPTSCTVKGCLGTAFLEGVLPSKEGLPTLGLVQEVLCQSARALTEQAYGLPPRLSEKDLECLAASRKRDKCGPRTGLGLLEGDVGPACLTKCQVRGGNWGFFLNPPPNLGKLLVPARLCERYCAFR